MNAGPLAGRRILVTRPRRQAALLAAQLREAGAKPLVFPAIEIEALPDTVAFDAIAARLEQFDLAIFISPSAVEQAMTLLRSARHLWPAALRVAAVGAGSRRALEAEGFTPVLAPRSGDDSEALLALPELARLEGHRVVIFRGAGGRPLLGDTLSARGASVTYAECYQRRSPRAVPAPLREVLERGDLDAVTIFSGEALENLIQLLGEGLGRLRETPFFVSHQRIAEQAAAHGLQRVRVAGPGDSEMRAALVAYFASAK